MALDDVFYRQMFDSNVAQLAGSPNRSILKRTCTYKKVAGEVAYVDHIGPISTWETRIADGTSPESAKALSAIRTRRVHEEDILTTPANDTFANFQLLETPHVEVERQRTLLTPQIIEWGHEFHKIHDKQEIVNLHSPVVAQGMRTIWGSEDYKVLSGLRAANVTRGRLQGDTASVAYSSNGLPVTLAFADYAGKLTVDGLAEIMEQLDGQYIPGERRYLLINETQKRNLIQSDKSTIFSADFIGLNETGARRFETGDLPDILGFTIIVHPQVLTTEAIAYTEAGICWGDFCGLYTEMSPRPDHRYSIQAYMAEYCDVKRVDDKRVVQASIPQS